MLYYDRKESLGNPQVLEKSNIYVGKNPPDNTYVPKSWFTDPFALMDSLGLGYKASPTSLSYETLRQMAEKNVIVSAIIQTRTAQVSSFNRVQSNKYSVGFKLSHKDKYKRLTEGELNFIKDMEKFIINCGADKSTDRDDFNLYVQKLVRDRLTFAQVGTEVVSKINKKPHSFYAVPAYSIRIASPKKRKGSPLNAKESEEETKYVQIIDGTIVNTYTPNELAFSIANPRTDLRSWNYGYSELEMAINTITSHLYAEQWNQRIFTQGSTTKGILNLKGNIPPDQFQAFKTQWLTQISGVSNAWRTPLLNSNEDIQWISLQPTNQEMGFREWMEYLIKVISSLYVIDPAEINFDLRGGSQQKPMFMSTNEAQQKISQDKGLRPLLRFIEDHLNKHIISKIDDSFEFEYVGVDAKTEAEAIDLRLKELQSYKTLNEIRESEQLPPVPYGDIVPNPSYIGYRNQKEMAELQQQQLGSDSTGAGQSGGTAPGFTTGEMPKAEQGKDERDVGRDILNQVGIRPSKKKEKEEDRYRPDESEDWTETYNASIRHVDLQEALEPLRGLTKY
jgi:hypothetical protein